MKKTLLITLLLTFPLFSFAQLPIGPAAGLLFSGVQAGSKSIKNRANKPGEFVTYFKVGQDSIPMKRTPAGKVRGDAASSIQQVESYLSGVHQLYLQPQTESICPDAQTGQYLLRAIATQQPKWDTTPYQTELAFYQQQHQHRYSAARQAEQRAREAAQRRYQARQDSVMQIARRQQALTDSTTRIAFIRHQAQRDSLERVAEAFTSLPKPVATVSSSARPVVHKKPTVTSPVRKPTGSVVYMCDSGNTVKYHASPTCRGLSRCNATVVKISKAEATQTMDGCTFCY
jgi:hypothetical protein